MRIPHAITTSPTLFPNNHAPLIDTSLRDNNKLSARFSDHTRAAQTTKQTALDKDLLLAPPTLHKTIDLLPTNIPMDVVNTSNVPKIEVLRTTPTETIVHLPFRIMALPLIKGAPNKTATQLMHALPTTQQQTLSATTAVAQATTLASAPIQLAPPTQIADKDLGLRPMKMCPHAINNSAHITSPSLQVQQANPPTTTNKPSVHPLLTQQMTHLK